VFVFFFIRSLALLVYRRVVMFCIWLRQSTGRRVSLGNQKSLAYKSSMQLHEWMIKRLRSGTERPREQGVRG